MTTQVNDIKPEVQNTEPVKHPDVFTRVEAMQYLKISCEKSFWRLRRRCGIKGVKTGYDYIYAREQLEEMRRAMFGLDIVSRRRGRGL